MAPESRATKKRKAAGSAASVTSKKTKKADPPAPATKRAQRKKAVDFYSDSEEEEAAGWEGLRTAPAKKKKDKKTKENKAAPKAPSPEPEPEPEPAEESGSSESEDEDQSATLLKGFESSDDEDEEGGVSVDGKEIVKAGIPEQKKVQKKLKGLTGRETTAPGIIYLGRIPHGFYEHEMRSYFSQFGTVTRLRLSRNKKTGKSKHYAFIEFADSDVAFIVADTMNNYLLFGHILKCKVVSRDNLEYCEQLMKGANKRYKARPRAKLAKAELEKKRPEEVWQKKVEKENKKRKAIAQKLKSKGIEYEFEPPVARKAVAEEEKPEPAPLVDEPKAVGETPKKKGKRMSTASEIAAPDVSEDAPKKKQKAQSVEQPGAVGKEAPKKKKQMKQVPKELKAVEEEAPTERTSTKAADTDQTTSPEWRKAKKNMSKKKVKA